MKRKIVVLGLCMCMVLAACGKEKNNTAGENTATGQVSQSSEGKLTNLGDYKTFTYEEYSYEITDQEIFDYYESTMEYYLDYGVIVYEKDDSRDGTAVQDGDTVNIDFTGYIDDVAFENGAGTDYDLTIGSGSFIDGFESALIGKTVGETVDIFVTFPDEYPNNPDMAGKDAKFTVKLNYVGTEVEITTDNAYKDLFGYETIEEMNADIKEALEQEYISAESSYYSAQKSEYIKKIVNGCEFENITEEVNTLINTELIILANAAASANTDVETLATVYYGAESYDAYKAQVEESSLITVKKTYVANEIAKLENITLSDEKYEELVLAQIEPYGYTDVAEYEGGFDSQYGEGSFRQSIFTAYVFDTIFEKYAVMTSAGE
ncbi:MAG: FKBP-type peptidyl-prolyl cis-trans isomerase [Lachnospiraceae bacterium]